MSFDTNTQLRITAATLAAQNAKAGTSPVKIAEEILEFLTAGEPSLKTSQKPATGGGEAKKASAPDTASAAKEQSSEKPAEKEKASTAASPSDKGAGFSDDGSEITLDQLRTAAVKFSAHPKGGEKKFVAKLKDLGSDNLSGLDPSRYGDLIAYLNGATAEVQEEEPEDKAGPFD